MTGYYTEITDMTVVPVSAVPGTLVNIDAYVKNIYTGSFYVALQGWVNSDFLDFGGEWGVVPYGSSLRFGDSFVMPSRDVEVCLASYYWDGAQWVMDDVRYYTVVTGEPVPPPGPISGQITKVEFGVNGLQTAPPVQNVMVDNSFILHVWGKNTSDETVKLGIRYTFTKPSGATITRYVNEAWPYTSAGETHHFVEGPAGIGTKFGIDEFGVWAVEIVLYGNDEVIDSYSHSNIFSMTVPPTEEPAGEIVEARVQVDSLIKPLPAAGVEIGDSFLLRVKVKNISTVSFRPCLYYSITKPDGATVERSVCTTGKLISGSTHEFIEGPAGLATSFKVDQPGDWSLYLVLMIEAGDVLDTYPITTMFTVSEEPPEYTGEITDVKVQKDSTQMSPPASGFVTGDDFILHAWCKNTSASRVKLGMEYTITKPDGSTIERFVEEFSNTGSGETHHFAEGPAGLGTSFRVDQEGEWLISIDLYGKDSILDTYSATLFTAEEGVLPPGEGITSLTILYSTRGIAPSFGDEAAPPISDITTNHWFKIKVTGVNPSATEATQMGLHYIVTKPDGGTIEDTVMEAWPYTGGGGDHAFEEPGAATEFDVDQVGEWLLYVELLAGSEDNVIDTWQGVIFAAEKAAMSMFEIMPTMLLMMMMMIFMSLMKEPMMTVKEIGKPK